MKWRSANRANPRIANEKLAPPRGALPVLVRERLSFQPDGKLPRLTLVRAPAGFGKTTLMQQWHDELTQLGYNVAWITLDSGDNAIARLTAHLIEALDRFSAHEARMEKDEQEKTIKYITDVISQSSQPLVLILDEIEALESNDAFDIIRHIAKISVSTFSLIVSGRTIPSIGQSRIALSSDVIDISDSDLRFNAEETRTLFTKRLGSAVTNAQSNALGKHLDGWAAGLQFACLALRDNRDVAGFVDYAVTHRMIYEYLREDVFNKLSDDMREFLLSISPFKVLTGGLCDAVTGRSDSEGMLQGLVEAGHFLKRIELGSRVVGYQFHDVFADFLRSQLALGSATRVADLRRSASTWYASQGMMFEAVDELIQVGDRVAALTLLDRVSMDYVSWGQFTALLKWNGKMSLEEGRRYPRAFISWLWAEMFCGNTALVDQVLPSFRDHLGTASLAPELRDNLMSLEIVNASASDRFAYVRDRGREAICGMHNANSWAGTSLANVLASAELAAGNLTEARSALEAARQTGRTSDRALNHAYSDAVETMMLVSELRLTEAIEISRLALSRAVSTRGPYSHAAGICASILCEMLYEADRLDEAEEVYTGRIATVTEEGFPDLILPINLTAARVSLVRGDAASANQILLQAEAMLNRRGLPRLQATLRWERARIALVGSNLTESGLIENEIPNVLDDSHLPYFEAVTRDIAPIRLKLLREETHHIVPRLVRLIAEAKRMGLRRRSLSLGILHAIALELEGRHDFAVYEMTRILRMGLPNGFRRIFLDEGPVAMSLIEAVSNSSARHEPQLGPHLDHLRSLASADSSALPTPLVAARGNLRSHLSPRELEIVDVAARGLTNAEIGSCLNLSEPTVKWHLQNAFRKLGVSTRTEAIFLTR